MVYRPQSRPNALAVVIAICAATALAAPTGTAARALQTGFLDDQSFHNPGPRVSAVWFAKAKSAGASLARININWHRVAPRRLGAGFVPSDPGDPAYDWRRIDDSVRGAVAHGLTPVLTVLRAPAWAEAPGRDPSAPLGSWRPDPGQLGAFAEAVAKRYSGGHADPAIPGAVLPRVAHFQAWNEPNLLYYLTPQYERGRPVSPTLYRSLLNSFYWAVKSVQPSATVLSAGLAPIGRRPWTLAPLQFMRRLTCMRGRTRPRPSCPQHVWADIWTTHPYTTGGPTHASSGRDDVSLGDLPEMTELLRAAERRRHVRGKHRRTPFWVTEFSWDTRPPDPGGVPMRLAKRWVAEALYRMWSAEVSAVIWLTIRDGPPPGAESSWRETYQSGFHFFHPDPFAGRPKPSLRAFRFPFVALPEGDRIRVWGRTPTSRRGPVLVQARVAGRWRTVTELRANRAGVFQASPRIDSLPGGRRPGALRARSGSAASLPFAPRPTRDRFVRPFGG